MITSTTTTVVVNAALGVLALAWILSRQLQKRPVKPSSLRVPVILAAVGLYEAMSFVRETTPSGATASGVPAAAVALLAAGIVVGAGLAAVRGRQVRVWRDTDGAVVRQGTALTVVLWLVAIAAHLGTDVAIDHVARDVSGLGTASLLLYLGVVLGIQGLVVQRRAQLLVARA